MKAIYMHAGTMPLGTTFPLIELFNRFISLFADDDESDKGASDDDLEDDLDKGFAEDEGDLVHDDEDDEKGKKDEDDDEKKSDKSKSAIHQKRKFRDLYKKTDAELKKVQAQLAERASDKGGEEGKKERDARNYLKGLIGEILDERDTTRSSKEVAEQEALDEELEGLLEDNEDLTEKKILEVVEELGISPTAAVKQIRREEKLVKKDKPNLPRSKRGGGEAESGGKDKKKSPTTLEEASRMAKESLKNL